MIARLAAVVAAAVPCLAAPAAAGPLADALARGDDAAIAELRRRPGDLGARCTLGAIYARRGELARAGFYFTDCLEAELPEDVAGPIEAAARATLRKLHEGELARIEVVTMPPGILVETDALPGEPFTTPATLWVRAGRHELRAHVGGKVRIAAFDAEARSRSLIPLDVRPEKQAAAPAEQQVSFEDEALAEQETAPPPDVRHGSIMPKKYRGVAALGEDEGEGEGAGAELVDPLAARAAVRRPRAHWLGARLAGGMFDDGRAGARAGLGVAAAGRYALATRPSGGPAAFLAVRLDWSRRGGDPDMSGTIAGDPIDVIGAGAGAGLTVLDRGALSLALIGQLRADLRLASARAGEPVRRAGLGAAATAELALPGTPIAAGLRLEHGLTELVAGARDRAILLEVGVDWR